MEKWRRRLQQFLLDVGMFIRFPTLGVSIMMALFGMVSVTTAVSGLQVFAVTLGAAAFHSFAYVFNDLIDLLLDRTDPRRVQFPLVRGSISPRQGYLFVLLQVLIAFAVTFWLDGAASAYLAIAAAFFFMAIYDVWGKRCILPPLTDLAQGIGWGCLALWAAALMPGGLTGLTWVLFIYLVIFIVLINGFHGSFRDLANDYKHGVRSTAIFLGVRPKGEDVLILPQIARPYAFVLQAALIVLVFIPFPGNMLDYTLLKSLLTILALIPLSIASWRLLQRALDAAIYRPQMLALGTLHLLSLVGMLLALFLFRFPWWLQIIVLVVFLGPLSLHSWVRNSLLWALRGKGADPPAPSDFPLTDSDPSETTIL